MDQLIPQPVASFLVEQIDSVVQLEVLLLVHAHPYRGWTPEELAGELRVDQAWVTGQLEYLTRRGLLSHDEPGVGPFRYAPRTPELGRIVDQLAALYSQRRVTIIGLIYSRPADPVRHLAEAFRIRKHPTPPEQPHG